MCRCLASLSLSLSFFLLCVSTTREFLLNGSVCVCVSARSSDGIAQRFLHRLNNLSSTKTNKKRKKKKEGASFQPNAFVIRVYHHHRGGGDGVGRVRVGERLPFLVALTMLTSVFLLYRKGLHHSPAFLSVCLSRSLSLSFAVLHFHSSYWSVIPSLVEVNGNRFAYLN